MKKNTILLFLCSFIITSLNASLITIQSEAQYDADVLANPRPVVVKFAASWCSVCQEVKEPFTQVAAEEEFQNIVFAQVDIDQLSAVCDRYDLQAVPTIMFFQSGQKKFQEIGVKDMRKFKEKLRNDINNVFGRDHGKPEFDASLKHAANQSIFGTVVASLKSAYDSMVGAVSSLWNRIVS